MTNHDAELRSLIVAIASGDAAKFSRLLNEKPELAKARFEITNATRQTAKENFIAEVARYIYRGDTAIHFAAAAHQPDVIRTLIAHRADVRARNRFGDEPLHAAATGDPDSPRWNPKSQSAAIAALIHAGADPNATNKMGVAPLHKAVRTRCAEAVRTLLQSGADPARKNKHGSDPMLLARMTTGRPGSGSPAAKAEQEQILKSLRGLSSD